METVTAKNEKDSRAISGLFLDKFKQNGTLEPFLKLVKAHKELELLFRGNSSKKGTAVIYRNNGAMFTITYPEKIEVNLDYLRYDIEWEKHLNILKNFFNCTDSLLPEIVESVDNHGKIKKECKIKNKLSTNVTNDLCNNLEDIYSLLSLVFYRYFDYCGDCLHDYFRDYVNKNASEENKIGNGRKKDKKIEKIRQQQLYTQIKKQKNGYYIYDLEFAQKNDRSESKNKPDMQAIRFNVKGKPVAWVLVEVKSTEGACKGKAGLVKHIIGMQEYISKRKLIENRCVEAYELLSQYNDIGLINWDTEMNLYDYKNLDAEIILIFTDEAIDVWNENKKDFSGYKERTDKLEDGSNYVLVTGVEKFKFI